MKTIFSSKKFVFLICVSLIVPDWNVVLAEEKTKRKSYRWSRSCYVAGGAAVLATPFLLGAAGFGSGGIAAGSFASKLMSWTAIAYGGGVPAGSFVALAQSVGATAGAFSSAKTFAMAVVGCKLIEEYD